jgi:hypothetical protein
VTYPDKKARRMATLWNRADGYRAVGPKSKFYFSNHTTCAGARQPSVCCDAPDKEFAKKFFEKEEAAFDRLGGSRHPSVVAPSMMSGSFVQCN